jgi:hypothetical protein
MPNEKNVTREEFVEEVRKFKLEKNVKLKEILQGKDERATALRKEFLANSTIRSYLARSADEVKFNENVPVLKNAAKKEERAKSDYYELRIYEFHPGLMPFRNRIKTAEFYESGIYVIDLEANDKKFEEEFTSNECKVVKYDDSYAIRRNLNYDEYKYFLDPEIPRTLEKFILTPNYSNTTTLLHIRDEQTHRVLATLFICPAECAISEEIRYRFNLPNHYRYFIEKNIENKIIAEWKQKFEFDETKSEQLIVDKDKKSLLAIDISRNYKYDELIKSLEIETIVSPSRAIFKCMIIINRVIPFINASHNLDLEEYDPDAGLYSLNFRRAIGSMLKDKTIADNIYQLAKKVDQGEARAQEELAHIFREDLKVYLPCYYENGQTKSPEAIKDFHLRQRWNIGSEKLAAEAEISR